MSCSSLFASTFCSDACSAFSTLPRSGRIAWVLPLAPLLGGAAGGVALDDEQLALGRIGRGAVGELAGQVQPVRDRRLARHRLRGRARRLARLGRQDDPRDDRLADGLVLEQAASPAPGAPRRRPGACDLGVVEPLLGLPLELRLVDVDRQHADEPLADVLGGERRRPWAPGLVASMKLRTALTIAARKPCSCVPPCVVGMPLTYERIVSSVRLGPLQRRLEPDAALACALEVERLRRGRRPCRAR